MTADLLTQAADLMEHRARKAQRPQAVKPGRWVTEHHNSEYNREPESCHITEDRKGYYWSVASNVYIPHAEHMAGMDPYTALHVAAWLRRAARRWWWLRDRDALAAARAYLTGEAAS